MQESEPGALTSGGYMELVYIVALFVLGFGAGRLFDFFKSYSQRKGENVAMAEDLKKLTALTEEVKAFYASEAAATSHERQLLIERLKAEQDLRTLVGSERFLAHQRAHTILLELVGWKYGDSTKVQEGYTFWRENGLYLDPEAREAFHHALHYWSIKNQTIIKGKMGEDADRAIAEASAAFDQAVRTVRESVGLPPLVDSKSPRP